MSEENKNEKHRGLSIVIAMAILLPVLYVLSIGPARIICTKHPKGAPAFREFYFPLIWLRDHTALREPLDWYAGLWM